MVHSRAVSRLSVLAAVLALATALSSLPAVAQQGDGQIAGTVRDATGAATPGATVTAADRTGQKRVATSGSDGAYAVTGVPAGVYTLTVALPGFVTASRTGVEVAGGGTARVDFTLETGKREEEITVTAMKTRTETVHDTPLSVVAMSDDLLHDRGAEDIEDVAANVAGFSVQNLGPGQSQVAIRGISAGQIVRDQPGVKEQVGVYLDESVVSLSLFTPDIDLFDVSRVEVLRGPQGTLFGSGSLSGTVRYITNQPELGVKRLFGELAGSTVNEGSQAGWAKLGANVPLGQKAALRVAGYYNRLAGYIDAVQPDLSVNEDVNTGYRSGVRAAISVAPSDRLIITPRFLYQKVKMDGWNRVDAFNILANPYTTTRPAVSLGERQEFAQLDEDFTDEFALADLTVSYNFGRVGLTSITSYIDRDVQVIRDATSLTGSVTGGTIGLAENVYTLDSPLIDATKAKLFTQELRLSGGGDRLAWVAGAFYSRTDRDYGQDLPTTGFTALTGIPTRGLRAPEDSLFWSELGYQLDQLALFGEATLSLTENLSLTAGLRYYNFSEDKQQVFDGIFAHDNTGTAVVSQPGSIDADGVAPRLILSYKVSDSTNLNAQVARGFRLGGINDPLNVPLCTAEDLVTFGGRETWKDETVWNYEVGSKTRILGNRGTLNVAAFYMDVQDLQATVTAGSCSSRLIFNVPEARTQGFEVELEAAPSRSFDFAVSSSYNDSELRSTVPPISATGIEDGRRLPTVPQFQLAAAATYQRDIGQDLRGYVTGTYQHVGSRYTQVGDPDLGTLDLLSFGANTIGAPLTASTFSYDPLLPAYDVLNLRVGVRRQKWDLSLYANNVTDERALLAFDRERGTRARDLLPDQPAARGRHRDARRVLIPRGHRVPWSGSAGGRQISIDPFPRRGSSLPKPRPRRPRQACGRKWAIGHRVLLVRVMCYRMSSGFVCSALASGCGGTGPASPPIVPATSVPCPSPAAAEPVTPTTSWNWEPVNSPSLQVQSVFVDPEDASVLYAGGRFGLYASSDGGGTWRLVLADAAVNGNALAFLPASSCTVFVGSGPQLQRSNDRGRTWHLVHAFPDLVRSIHVSRDSRRIYVGPQVDPRFSQSADGIWVSADLGSTWTLSPLPTPSRGLIPWDIAEDAAGVLYAGTEIYDHPQPYRPLYYRSRDSGTAWEEVTGRLPWHVIKTEAHPTRVTVYALTEGGGLYVTEDEGTNWSRRGRTTFSSELLLDPRSPTTLYAGEHTFGGQPGGAYVSTDEGNSFHAIGLDGRIVGSLALDGASRRLYAASYQSGLFRATVPSQR